MTPEQRNELDVILGSLTPVRYEGPTLALCERVRHRDAGVEDLLLMAAFETKDITMNTPPYNHKGDLDHANACAMRVGAYLDRALRLIRANAAK